jgi:IMP dehydrogenase
MNSVTGKRMGETMARFGGLGILPQDMELGTVERIVEHIKGADPYVDTALHVTADATLRDVQGILYKRSHDMVVVVDDEHRPIGLITAADLRERDQYTAAERLMTRRPVTLEKGISHKDAFERMEEERLKAMPVVDGGGRLCGVLTRDDCVRFELLQPSLDPAGRLMVGAAIGISEAVADNAKELMERGVDVLVLDTAHGHQRRMLDALRAAREVVGPDFPLVAGNVCTAEGTRALIEAGADVVKVNVGPGAMCSTRMKTGAGRPTFSSVRAAAAEAAKHGKYVWADGGVRHPRDVALYLAAGAARVMVGTLFAATWESPGDMRSDEDGRRYKASFGMASTRAVLDRTEHLDAFDRAKRALFDEGISSSRVYLNPGKESTGGLLVDILTGVKSAFSYVGAADWAELQEKAVIGVQTLAGFTEGRPRPQVNR